MMSCLRSLAAGARVLLLATTTATATIAQTTTPVGATEAIRWREDLAQFAHFLTTEHADLNRALNAGEFGAMVGGLDAKIPELTRHEIIVELARIAAAIGDGHTSVHLLFDADVGFHRLPLRLGWFEEGIFVEAVKDGVGVPAGARLIAIGGVPIAEAVRRVTPLISRDNDIWIRVVAPLLLRSPEVLHAIGLSDDPGSALLAVETDGRRTEIRMTAMDELFTMPHGAMIDATIPSDWSDAKRTGAAPVPIRARHPGTPYWFEHLAEQQLLYIQYNMVNNADHGPSVHEFFRGAMHVLDENPIARVVLDLRHNSGGEGTLNTEVVRQLILRPELQRRGSLIVLIGRHTFSAAQLLVHLLDLWTPAVFVGEPTGSGPQFWGDHRLTELAHSRIDVSAAPTWHQPGGPYDRREFMPPLLAFEPRFNDYVADRDPAVEAILAWDNQELDLTPVVVKALVAGDTAAAAATARAWDANPVHRYVPSTSELNRAGYAVLADLGGAAALAVFRLNVSIHPDYANGWDSLGDVLLRLGRREEGLAAYRRAYELDPRIGRAAEVLGLKPD